MTQHTIHIMVFATIAAVTLAMVTGCVYELGFEESATAEYRGEPVDAYLDITVGEMSVSMGTRADGDDEDPYEDTVAERWVNDLWVFQYNASTEIACAEPIYLTVQDQETLKNLPVTLTDNNGEESLIYVVTNTGSSEWGIDGAFNSVDGLLTSALPTREPIFVTTTTENNELSIPMEGNSGTVRVSDGKTVRVPVSRMYAKIMIDPVLELDDTEYYSVSVGNIPLYCQVGTLAEGLDPSEAATYPDGVQWISRAVPEPLVDDTNAGTGVDLGYRYVVYVPENLAGQTDTKAVPKTESTDAPAHALQVSIVITYYDPDDEAETHYPYTFYPGADTYYDYNIRRNNVYRVKASLYTLSVARVPSANCMVAIEGETISFFPYYRVETGGGYDFTDYLDPNGSDDAQTDSGAKIDHVGIVWQTQDCIGDNSNGTLVYLTNDAGNQTTSHNGYEQIHVHANKEGNALIAAYDTQDNIIWSWHIWVRTAANGDPTHPASALIYYTYDWDETGIYSYQREEMDDGATHRRIASYELMACNLGALQDEPNYANNEWFLRYTDPAENGMQDQNEPQTFQSGDGIVRTFGMLYQWGRKDPFPPMTVTDGCLAKGGYAFDVDDHAYNTGYYVHNYDDAHTEQLYGNDNKTAVHKTSYENEDYLFHTHIHNTTTDVITGMRYSIAHPTVFLSGATQIAGCLSDCSDSDPDITTRLSSSSTFASAYVYGGAWSDEDHDNKEWGGLEPDENSMKFFHLKYPNYATTSSSKRDTQIVDKAGRTISLWDNYDDDTGMGSKTIFDPCPYGWRVGSGDLWLGFTRNGISPYVDYDRNCGSSGGSMANINRDPERSCALGMTMYLGQEWMTEPSTWFPCQGFILPDGCGYRVGGCGNYVNANTDVDDRINIVHFHEALNSYRSFEVQTHYTAKSTGNPLRCVRDTM